MLNFSSEIIYNLSKFLQIEDIINFELTNRKIYNSHVYKSLIWKNHNKTDLDNKIFKLNTKKMYNSFKKNLCHLCDKSVLNNCKVIRMLCFNCTSVFNTESNLIVVHKSCFINHKCKLSKFANVFNCKCFYCDTLVMAYIS